MNRVFFIGPHPSFEMVTTSPLYRPSGRRSLVIRPIPPYPDRKYCDADAERTKTCYFQAGSGGKRNLGRTGRVVEGFRLAEPKTPHSN